MKNRLLFRFARTALRGFIFPAYLLRQWLRIHADPLRVNLPKLGMVLDLAVKQRLRDRRIVHLAVSVAPEADQIHNYVGAKSVAIFQS